MFLVERLKYNKKSHIPLNALQKSMKSQIEEKISSGIYVFEDTACGVCNSKESLLIGEKDRYGLLYKTVACKKCGLVYTNPRMNQSSYKSFYNEEYRKLYVGKENPTEDFFMHQAKIGRNIFNFLKSEGLIKKPLRVLEVGCGAGGILFYFKSQGHTVKGIDLGSEYIEYGANMHQLDLSVGFIKDIDPTYQPDIIIYSHVLEHILDIESELKQISKFCNKNTLLYIEVPGLKYIHKMYSMDILKYFQNAHTYHFSLRTLSNILGNGGFQLVTGNEFIRSVFKKTTIIKSPVSDFPDAIKYLKKIEKYKFLYPLTYGLKGTLTKVIVMILSITNTRNFVRRARHGFRKSASDKIG